MVRSCEAEDAAAAVYRDRHDDCRRGDFEILRIGAGHERNSGFRTASGIYCGTFPGVHFQ
ncbi:hypothetical protein D3C75_1387240 [compost metagenome]